MMGMRQSRMTTSREQMLERSTKDEALRRRGGLTGRRPTIMKLILCYRNCDLQNLKAVHMSRETILGSVIWRFGSVLKLLLDICFGY